MDKFMNTELAAAKKVIDAVDLNPTIDRLVKVHHWTKKQAIAASKQYRNYLFLRKKYGDSHALPPSYDIDEVWHAHILHTEDYCNFCNQVFGGFLHHHPHHGKDNSITDEELAMVFETQTQRLYQLEFGEEIAAIRSLPFSVIIKRFFEFFKNTMTGASDMNLKKT